MALKMVTKYGEFEITVEGDFSKTIKIKNDNVDLQIPLEEKEVDDLTYMLRGH